MAPVVFVARYCDLVGQWFREARAAGLLGPGGVIDGSPEELGGFGDRVGLLVGEMRDIAPNPITPDIALVTTALARAAPGDLSDVEAGEFAAASARIVEHQQRTCTIAEPEAGGAL